MSSAPQEDLPRVPEDGVRELEAAVTLPRPAASFVDRTDEGQPWGSGPGHRAPGGRTPMYPRGARPCWPRQPLFLHSE